jgi:hypothetical protein
MTAASVKEGEGISEGRSSEGRNEDSSERKLRPWMGSSERVMTRLPSLVVMASGSYHLWAKRVSSRAGGAEKRRSSLKVAGRPVVNVDSFPDWVISRPLCKKGVC